MAKHFYYMLELSFRAGSSNPDTTSDGEGCGRGRRGHVCFISRHSLGEKCESGGEGRVPSGCYLRQIASRGTNSLSAAHGGNGKPPPTPQSLSLPVTIGFSLETDLGLFSGHQVF